MIETKIEINKPFLSLRYDIENDVLIGDNTFDVVLLNIGDEEPTSDVVTFDVDENLILTPNPVYASERPITVTVSLANDAIIPEGDFNFTLKASNVDANDVSLTTSIVAKNVDDVPEELVYKLKYFIQRENWRLNIYENVLESVILVPIEINGTCEMSRQERKDLFEPIIATNLDINLEASLEMDLSDLYFEDERHFKVEVLRNNEIEFLGFILPDGIWKSFVADKWVLKLKATDGLASLKNTSFAQNIASIDGNPLNFYGRMTALQIIDICLKKTGLNLNTNTICYLEYMGFAGGTIFGGLYLSVERYFQNDTEPMDCDAVLRSLMQVFNATLVQQGGEWWIYRTIDLRDRNIVSTFGNGISGPNYAKFFGSRLGSEINEVEIFHCTANQMESISPSVQAYQVSYQFGNAKNILANGGLLLEGTGLNIPGWDIHTTPDGLVDRGVRVGYNYGVRSAVRPLNPLPYLLTLNQSISITQGAGMLLSIKYRNDGQNSLYLNFAFGVQDGATIYWFNLSTRAWQTTGLVNRVDNYNQQVVGGSAINYGNGDATFNLEVISPIAGNVVIQIFRNGHGPGGLFGVHGVSLSASDKNIKSKDYTGRRKQKKSTSVKSNVTVFNGDSGSDLFVGTIFQADSDTPTQYWHRYQYIENIGTGTYYKDDYPETKEILSINAEDNLKISPRPMTIFEGDFKGYINYVDFFTIDSLKYMRFDQEVDKKFQFTKWSYSFDKDITKMNCKEYNDDYFFFDDQFTVNIKENFGAESRVTLIG